MRYIVTVKPGSKKGPLIIESENQLTVYLREKAIDGAANAALIKLLADYFRVPKTCISIRSGARARLKVVEIP